MQARYFAPRGDFRPQALAAFDLAQDEGARFGWESGETQGEIFDSFIGMGFDEFVVFGAIDHLGNGRIVGTGLCAGFEIEMPPFGGQDAKTAGGHGFAQDATQTDVFGVEDAAAHELGFVANMSRGTEIVDGRSHGQTGGIAGGIAEILGRKNFSKGVKVEVGEKEAAVDLYIIVKYGIRIPEVALAAQENVKRAIETMTGLSVVEVNVHVQGVGFPEEEPKVEESRVH